MAKQGQDKEEYASSAPWGDELIELKHLGEFKYASDTLDFAFGGQQRTN